MRRIGGGRNGVECECVWVECVRRWGLARGGGGGWERVRRWEVEEVEGAEGWAR